MSEMSCASCGEEIDTQYHVLRRLPDGEREEILVCRDCIGKFELYEMPKCFFAVLGGPVYSEKDRLPFWSNDAPLHYKHGHVIHCELPYLYNELPHIDMEKYNHFIKTNVVQMDLLPLHDFPLIEDCEIILEGVIREGQPERQPEYTVWLFSPSRGHLVHFCYFCYSLQILSQQDFVIPHGDFSAPYAESDGGAWSILLFEDEEFVYVLGDSGDGPWWEHRTWFKIEKSRYYSEWEKAIQLCRTFEQPKSDY